MCRNCATDSDLLRFGIDMSVNRSVVGSGEDAENGLGCLDVLDPDSHVPTYLLSRTRHVRTALS